MKKVKILALVLAVITGFLLYNFLNSISKPVVTEVSKKTVVTAAADIFPDTLITSDMLKLKELPEESVHALAVNNIDEAVGKVADSIIIAGEQVLSSKLIEPGDGAGTLAYKVKTGMRAITVGVTNTTGLSNMIIPNNMVDIIGLYEIEEKDANGDTKTVGYTNMLLENVKVLAVDSCLTAKDKESLQTPYVALTLEVTPLQAMEVSMTERNASLRAIIRSPLDEGINRLPALTMDKVIFKNN